ncbi:MAG: hypothetical protein A2527_13240 [Candidatus Lambdaproteobacteria bacterium RIFOXYD2_FULL_50_16]|uniref:Nicotinamide riboside transporter PnuC n=1 Tax=Candidatus Lambdaproteobacteria bacterium RIFOXYD2_FULL_50_16 TaxID=1817772 RepID=A0A1F6GG77_9PROT|nr:MAG: hypothetical protein A2527_13240 [Candidatus Lambdaproteobacteria bacterium RIFOXYD2_FULL_50_16]
MDPWGWLDQVAQVAIVLLGGGSIWLIGRKESWMRWGYIVGLISQPFWFWAAWRAEQWGLFLLCFWYLYSWSQGIWNYWFKPACPKPD